MPGLIILLRKGGKGFDCCAVEGTTGAAATYRTGFNLKNLQGGSWRHRQASDVNMPSPRFACCRNQKPICAEADTGGAVRRPARWKNPSISMFQIALDFPTRRLMFTCAETTPAGVAYYLKRWRTPRLKNEADHQPRALHGNAQ